MELRQPNPIWLGQGHNQSLPMQIASAEEEELAEVRRGEEHAQRNPPQRRLPTRGLPEDTHARGSEGGHRVWEEVNDRWK